MQTFPVAELLGRLMQGLIFQLQNLFGWRLLSKSVSDVREHLHPLRGFLACVLTLSCIPSNRSVHQFVGDLKLHGEPQPTGLNRRRAAGAHS